MGQLILGPERKFNCLIKANQCKNKNTFGRHASNGPIIKRDFASKKDIDFSITKFRFCYKFKKIRN